MEAVEARYGTHGMNRYDATGYIASDLRGCTLSNTAQRLENRLRADCLNRGGRRVVRLIRATRSFAARWPTTGAARQGSGMSISMSSLDDDLKAMIRRNKLLGMWAAEKLGLVGESAEAYSNDLAVGTLDPERNDVLSKIRKDFDLAGVAQSDEEILRIMNEFWLQASRQRQSTRADAVDGAAVQLARKLSS
jgi:hypothetical protein